MKSPKSTSHERVAAIRMPEAQREIFTRHIESADAFARVVHTATECVAEIARHIVDGVFGSHPEVPARHPVRSPVRR